MRQFLGWILFMVAVVAFPIYGATGGIKELSDILVLSSLMIAGAIMTGGNK